ncbi:hypothetical protein HN451_08175, partial [archaeon]|nr:hypothetical protein [archaeon]
MTLDKVKQEILDKTNKDNQKIIEEAKKEAKGIKELGKKDISEYKKNLEENELRIIKEYKIVKDAALDFGIRRHKFEVDSKLMELTKDEAYKSLKGLKSAKRKSHINKLLKIVSKQMDIARVYCNKKDESLINGFEVVKSEVVGGIIAENS